MTHRPLVLASLLALLLAGARSSAVAQTLPLAELLPKLLGENIVLLPDERADQPNHLSHFSPGLDQQEVPGQFNLALLTLLSTYPLGSPSGGFSYTFDPALGTFRRNSESFGPMFAERALTIGRGKLSVGFGYQHATYDTFEGKNLRQRELTFYLRHVDCCGRAGGRTSTPDGSLLTPAFEGDLIQASLALNLSSDTSVVFANYGVTDRFDIGLAVPFVRVKVDASVLAHIERLSTANEPETHRFAGGDPDRRLFQLSGQAAGLGDIVLRGKYRLLRAASGGLGVAVDVRVPTGDETNLLGTGGVQGKTFVIASGALGPFSPHANVGYTFSSRGALPASATAEGQASGGAPLLRKEELKDEVTSAMGFELTLSPRVTFSADVLTRTLRDAGRLREVEKTFEYVVGGVGGGTGGGGGGTGGGAGGGGTGTASVATQKAVYTELQRQSGDLHVFLGTTGVRFNPWRNLLVSLNLLFPLTDAGLRDRVTPVVGIDYAF